MIACPGCGQSQALLVTAPVLLAQDPEIGGWRTWGEPMRTTAMLPKDAPAICNFTACGWTGTVNDLLPT